MTYKQLLNILVKNQIPQDTVLMSDSGWECYATDMDGIYYNRDKKTIVFTQSFSHHDINYNAENGWVELI